MILLTQNLNAYFLKLLVCFVKGGVNFSFFIASFLVRGEINSGNKDIKKIKQKIIIILLCSIDFNVKQLSFTSLLSE